MNASAAVEEVQFQREWKRLNGIKVQIFFLFFLSFLYFPKIKLKKIIKFVDSRSTRKYQLPDHQVKRSTIDVSARLFLFFLFLFFFSFSLFLFFFSLFFFPFLLRIHFKMVSFRGVFSSIGECESECSD